MDLESHVPEGSVRPARDESRVMDLTVADLTHLTCLGASVSYHVLLPYPLTLDSRHWQWLCSSALSTLSQMSTGPMALLWWLLTYDVKYAGLSWLFSETRFVLPYFLCSRAGAGAGTFLLPKSFGGKSSLMWLFTRLMSPSVSALFSCLRRHFLQWVWMVIYCPWF